MSNPQFKNEVSVPFVLPTNLSDQKLRYYILEKVNLIDSTKRQVTEQMSRFHDATAPKQRGREYCAWVKRVKSYKSHLTGERDRLIRITSEINSKLKASRILKSQKPGIKLSQCFMIIAEQLLDHELFAEIEQKALQLLEN